MNDEERMNRICKFCEAWNMKGFKRCMLCKKKQDNGSTNLTKSDIANRKYLKKKNEKKK